MQIWFDIWKDQQLDFLPDWIYFFPISTPSPLKTTSKLTNISKMAIFSNIRVDQGDSRDTYGES